MTRGPRHVIRQDNRADHRATRTCPCGPVAGRDLAEPSLLVWIHRTPPPEAPKLRGALPEPEA